MNMLRFGEKEPFRFVDREKIEQEHQEAVESGVLDPDKVEARKRELEKEYQERKEYRERKEARERMQATLKLAGDFAKARVEMKG